LTVVAEPNVICFQNSTGSSLMIGRRPRWRTSSSHG